MGDSADGRVVPPWWESLLEPGAEGVDAAMFFLCRVQRRQNWIPGEAVALAARHYGVEAGALREALQASLYCRTEPCGRVLVEVCHGWACREGGHEILDELKRLSGLETGAMSADGSFSLEAGGCQGRCGSGPNLRLNGKPFEIEGPGQAWEALWMAKRMADELAQGDQAGPAEQGGKNP